MNLITIDFETYYDDEYSLSKMTTEEYLNDERFQIIGLSVKVNNGSTDWLSGTHKQLRKYLKNNYDWRNSAVLAHNTLFDGAILHWILGINPKVFLDTLCMAKAKHGVEVGGSLAKLAVKYKLGEKGTEVINAKGKRREDFSEGELERYGDYCIQDTELTYSLFNTMAKHFPTTELKVIDRTLRMFIQPKLKLNTKLLKKHLKRVRKKKEKLLQSVQTTRTKLNSNPQFAKLLEELGIEPPMKISPTTGNPTYAFAKTDPGFVELLEHDDLRVQALCTARIGVKSTLEETRTERLIGIAKRNDGKFPIPIRYYAAHTGRWGGMDKVNVQNFPSRGKNAKVLKSCITAPKGYVIVDADSAQIEARVLGRIARQDDLTDKFARKEDVYKYMASDLYNKLVEEVTGDERFVGKTTVLGSGYGMGGKGFKRQLGVMGREIDLDEAFRIIGIYRDVNHEIVKLWYRGNDMLESMVKKEHCDFDPDGIIEVVPKYNAMRMPSGLLLRYPDLTVEAGEKGPQYTYHTRKGRKKIYGGKVTENACQGIARCIIAEQMLRVSRRYPVLLTVHDSLVMCVKEAELDTALPYIAKCMRWTPGWISGLPLDCDISVGKSYGGCEEWQETEDGSWRPPVKDQAGLIAA